MSNIELDQKLSIRNQRNKSFVVEGIVKYPINVNVNTTTITCPCMLSSVVLCKHVVFYMYSRGIDICLLDYWIRLKPKILEQIINENIDNDQLWSIVENEIFDVDCGFCLERIKDNNNQEIHICNECQGILHKHCFKKWNKKGNGCMLCRSGSSIK